MTLRDEVRFLIEQDFAEGWQGTADDWWAQHPEVTTINFIAPVFTSLKQEGTIAPTGVKKRTRHGGVAQVYRQGKGVSMADGYRVIVKINLPPVAQYHSGHSVIVQGDDVNEVALTLSALLGEDTPGTGLTILRHFGDQALQKAAESSLKAPAKPRSAAQQAAIDRKTAKPAAKPAAGEELAEPAVLKVIAKRTGKTLGELEGTTKSQAQALLSTGGK